MFVYSTCVASTCNLRKLKSNYDKKSGQIKTTVLIHLNQYLPVSLEKVINLQFSNVAENSGLEWILLRYSPNKYESLMTFSLGNVEMIIQMINVRPPPQ